MLVVVDNNKQHKIKGRKRYIVLVSKGNLLDSLFSKSALSNDIILLSNNNHTIGIWYDKINGNDYLFIDDPNDSKEYRRYKTKQGFTNAIWELLQDSESNDLMLMLEIASFNKTSDKITNQNCIKNFMLLDEKMQVEILQFHLDLNDRK